MDQHLLEKGAALILKGMGVDLTDRNYINTPERYAKAIMEMFSPPETEWATFPEKCNNLILLRDHRMYSMCPHHLFPVKLFVSVAYIPNGHVLGLSKLARIMHDCNRGPLLQEAFTKAVVDRFKVLCPSMEGAACLVEGRHGCSEMRGIKSDAHFYTYSMTGKFQESERLQDRFFALCRTPGK